MVPSMCEEAMAVPCLKPIWRRRAVHCTFFSGRYTRPNPAQEDSVADEGPVDQGLLEDKASWQFDGSVTDVFDNMLSRSIPQYEVMREAVFELG